MMRNVFEENLRGQKRIENSKLSHIPWMRLYFRGQNDMSTVQLFVDDFEECHPL